MSEYSSSFVNLLANYSDIYLLIINFLGNLLE